MSSVTNLAKNLTDTTRAHAGRVAVRVDNAAMARARKPELYADAAYAVITRPSRDCTGNAFLCEDVLAAEGVTDFDRYAYQPGTEPQADLFVDHA